MPIVIHVLSLSPLADPSQWYFRGILMAGGAVPDHVITVIGRHQGYMVKSQSALQFPY